MARKNRVEQLYDRHYRDMLQLNRDFVQALNRPRVQLPIPSQTAPLIKKKLTKKQLSSLARGRKILSLNRSKSAQV